MNQLNKTYNGIGIGNAVITFCRVDRIFWDP